MSDRERAIEMVKSAMRCEVTTPEQVEKKALLPIILKALQEAAN